MGQARRGRRSHLLVIIAGTRHKIDPQLLEQAIAESGFDITCVISGAAQGVDLLGERWAQDRGICVRSFPADWERYGRGAGPRRNEEMACVGEALIALPCAHSKGTKDMIERARRHRLKIFQMEVPCQSKPRVRKRT